LFGNSMFGNAFWANWPRRPLTKMKMSSLAVRSIRNFIISPVTSSSLLPISLFDPKNSQRKRYLGIRTLLTALRSTHLQSAVSWNLFTLRIGGSFSEFKHTRLAGVSACFLRLNK
jgi:hypothetical protein